MDDCPLFKYAVVLGVQFYSFLFMKAIGLTKRKKKKQHSKQTNKKLILSANSQETVGQWRALMPLCPL